MHYTVGQRKGLGISAAGRLFVKEINVRENKIVLSDSKVLKRELLLTSPVFSGIAPEDLEKEEDLYVKLRYTATPVKASAHFAEEGIVVTMEEDAPFVTPGQSAVFYRGDRIAFGGVVER